ncbi:chemotaxis protein CheB [Jannaschia sp. S6380]|uniref:chemotaxis protein CheB n=1 Tax=Jannaschia sp. S6380 TaxID=2926408 RepID=UPI001FF5D550|nr:chemotaxis protein CheB [Jannaschia sp. S6380]MCK0169080.1 chemotaxis protein CheB [Jannaschia sp. S6380]
MDSSRDTVVIGGSAGAFSVLKGLLGQLPADLGAAVFVTLHFTEGDRGHAAELLAAASALPPRVASEGQPIEAGTVTFAPPNRHLLLGEHHVHVRRGPRENGFRPAVDPMFRSAAVYRGTRSIAVVLSGLLDDGAVGLEAVARQGGLAIVQDPADADFPDMPLAAQSAVPGATLRATAEIAGEIARQVGRPVAAPTRAPDKMMMELKIAGLEGASMSTEDQLGTLSPYNCPDCNGVLWEVDDSPVTRFRCHTGHAYTIATLDDAQQSALERSLYDALRANRGRADLLRRMAERTDTQHLRERHETAARKCEEDAHLLERIILGDRAG